MKLIIEIIFIIITLFFAISSIGEKDNTLRINYLFGTIVMAALTMIAVKFL